MLYCYSFGEREIMDEIKEQEPSNGKHEKEPLPPEPESKKEFKVAEIWVRGKELCLDAPGAFYNDRKQAIKTLMACIEILLDAKGPKQEKPKIVTGQGMGPLDYLKNRLKGKK